jgi:hypothetical protein
VLVQHLQQRCHSGQGSYSLGCKRSILLRRFCRVVIKLKDERKEMKRKLNKLKPEYDGNQHPRNHEESQQLNQYYLETAPDEINTNYTYQKKVLAV